MQRANAFLLVLACACGGESGLPLTETDESHTGPPVCGVEWDDWRPCEASCELWERVELEPPGECGVLLAGGKFAPVLRLDDPYVCSDTHPGEMCLELQADESASFLVRQGESESEPQFVPVPCGTTCQDYFDSAG